jgi:hypothetical protein
VRKTVGNDLEGVTVSFDGDNMTADQLASIASGVTVTRAPKGLDAPDMDKSGLDVQLAYWTRRAAAGDPNAAAQAKITEEAIAKADSLRRDPRAPASNDLSAYQAVNVAERLAGAWRTTNQPVKEMERQLRIMQTGLKRFRGGDKNGGSQAVLVTFQKILDPTSVVRESEYARTTEGQAFMDRIEGYATRLAQGGTTLTDRELAEMVQTARDIFDGMASWSAGTRRRITAQAQKNGIDPALVFDDVLTGAPDAPARPAQPSAPTPAKIGRFQVDVEP